MLAANVLQLERELVDVDETVDGDALDAGRWGKRLEQPKFHLIERREGLCRSNLCNLEGQVHVTNRVADRVLTETTAVWLASSVIKNFTVCVGKA